MVLSNELGNCNIKTRVELTHLIQSDNSRLVLIHQDAVRYVELDSDALMLSLDEFSRKYIQPNARSIAWEIPQEFLMV